MHRAHAHARARSKLAGMFKLQHWRAGLLLATYKLPNGVVNVGLDDVLSVYFDGGTQSATWYVGLIDDSGFTGLASGDTMSSHAGWSEFTGYTSGTRTTWPNDAPSGQSITNTTTADFSINMTGDVKGAFLVNNSSKGGTTGILYSTAIVATAVPVVSSDTLRAIYTVTHSDQTP